jgi:GDP-4-dehydro-6-deoxy-D-mannose reductase
VPSGTRSVCETDDGGSSPVRTLVTGAGGFVGRHMVRHLEATGHQVVATDRSDGGPDLADAQAIADLVRTAAPTSIVHLAGWSDVGSSWHHPDDAWNANATGTLHVLEAAVAAGVDRVLVASSAEVYGSVDAAALPIDETQPLAPANPYAAAKAAAEMLTLPYASRGLAVIRTRAFNHLGPGQRPQFVAPALASRILDAIRTGAATVPVGRLDTRRDFTDVRDVVAAYAALLRDGVGGEAYNVCSGVDRSIAQIAELILEVTGAEVELVPDPALQRPHDVPVLRGDNTKVRAATGWEPTIALSQTIADLVAALR